MLIYEKAKPLGGESLNYRVWGNPAPALGIGTNLLCNTYDNRVDGITKTENGGLQINPAEFTSGVLMISFPVYLESGKTYTVRSPYDATHGKLGLLNITGTVSGFQDNGTAPYKTFTWGSKNVGKLTFSFDVDVLDSIGETITFYPQINEGSKLLDYELYRTKENTIWVNTDIDINEHAFGYENPWVYYEDVDLLNGVSLGDGYIKNDNTDTIVTEITAANPEKYTIDYIPVSFGATYNINYTISGTSKKSLWFAYLEYTGTEGNYTAYGVREELVNGTSGLSQTFTYIPSTSDITAVRFCWRTFPNTTCTVTITEPNVRFNNGLTGDVWIQTDIDNASVSFNAIKRNELMIYPYKLKQWDDNRWKSMNGTLYSEGTTTLAFSAEEPLYTYGIQNVAWSALGDGGSSGSTTFGESSVTIKAKGSYSNSARYQNMYTTDKIDLTDYTTIKAVVSGYALNNEGKLSDSTNGWFHLGIMNKIERNLKDYAVSSININPETKTDDVREVELDVSSFIGEYYIVICMRAYRINDATNTGYVHSVWME